MNKNLLIIGAGIYGVVTKEIAESMGRFEKIDFADDSAKATPNGIKVIGTTNDIENLVCEYHNIVVAIGNPDVRLRLIRKFVETLPCRIVTLVSPRAFVSPSAQIGMGCIIEPMAVIHTGAVISVGCIISSGAVVNHASMCCDGVHVDCNATVAGNTIVPAGTKVQSGTMFSKDTVSAGDLFIEKDISKRCPLPIDGMEYTFEDGV